jgi:sulfur carrier protein
MTDFATRVAAVPVVVNGQALEITAATTVADVLAARGLARKRVAVEVNGAIVPRSRHAATIFAPGDRVEIVVAVGGG